MNATSKSRSQRAMQHPARAISVLISGVLGLGSAVYGGQPPDVVQSDDYGNVAMGPYVLLNLTDGQENTGAGLSALLSNQSGGFNTAVGFHALSNNLDGSFNTAVGESALILNLDGIHNTAVGESALYYNNHGIDNTAVGYVALNNNAGGSRNAAVGNYSLTANENGNDNAAFGFNALSYNTGDNNTASGAAALIVNTTGNNNTAVGFEAMDKNSGGSNNIALGQFAGSKLTTGNNNIDIGNVGSSGEGNVIRIGTANVQSETFIAGIENSKVTGNAVFVTSKGQLGVLASSERYKTAIAPMGATTMKLHQLRPVTFHLKTDPRGAMQYGLVAEEVAKVYPELVIRDEAGNIQGVRYDELASMLLNEMQRLSARVAALDKLEQEMHGQELHDTPQIEIR